MRLRMGSEVRERTYFAGAMAGIQRLPNTGSLNITISTDVQHCEIASLPCEPGEKPGLSAPTHGRPGKTRCGPRDFRSDSMTRFRLSAALAALLVALPGLAAAQ